MIAQVNQVVLAFGSNQGERSETIRAAEARLAQHPSIQNVRMSPFRETLALTPTGIDPSAPKYLNAVATLSTTLTAPELLSVIQGIEAEFGRVRTQQWADRTLDIDIIMFGGKTLRTADLTIPHPRAHERDFVLAPWAELDPDAVLISHGRVADLLAQLGDTTRAYVAEASS
jgi:2-amino-4-hydroxy-6-hydroxymethyldihydropteridine diphosphokinase